MLLSERDSLTPVIAEVLRPADALIIIPPAAAASRPSLGAHVLQACGRAIGKRVATLYANLHLASVIGEVEYDNIVDAPNRAFVGERMFARAAYGVPPLGFHPHDML